MTPLLRIMFGALILLPACAGKSLDIGDDDRHGSSSGSSSDSGSDEDAGPGSPSPNEPTPTEPVPLATMQSACAKRTGKDQLHGLSPVEGGRAGTALLRGRWFGCLGNVSDPAVPNAIEFVSSTEAYELVSTGTGYVRGRELSISCGYSLGPQRYYIRFDAHSAYNVTFEEHPQRMTFTDEDVTVRRARFVKAE